MRLSPERILRSICGIQDVFIDDNALSVHMTRIRNKLSGLGVENLIKTKRGMGYQL